MPGLMATGKVPFGGPSIHDGERFFEGYWEGPHGRLAHDHPWDRDHRNRDFGRDHDRH
jgi:hypothetical protein